MNLVRLVAALLLLLAPAAVVGQDTRLLSVSILVSDGRSIAPGSARQQIKAGSTLTASWTGGDGSGAATVLLMAYTGASPYNPSAASRVEVISSEQTGDKMVFALPRLTGLFVVRVQWYCDSDPVTCTRWGRMGDSAVFEIVIPVTTTPSPTPTPVVTTPPPAVTSPSQVPEVSTPRSSETTRDTATTPNSLSNSQQQSSDSSSKTTSAVKSGTTASGPSTYTISQRTADSGGAAPTDSSSPTDDDDPNSNPTSDPGGGGLGTGELIGIGVGVGLLVAMLVWYLLRLRRRRRQTPPTAVPERSPDGSFAELTGSGRTELDSCTQAPELAGGGKLAWELQSPHGMTEVSAVSFPVGWTGVAVEAPSPMDWGQQQQHWRPHR